MSPYSDYGNVPKEYRSEQAGPFCGHANDDVKFHLDNSHTLEALLRIWSGFDTQNLQCELFWQERTNKGRALRIKPMDEHPVLGTHSSGTEYYTYCSERLMLRCADWDSGSLFNICDCVYRLISRPSEVALLHTRMLNPRFRMKLEKIKRFILDLALTIEVHLLAPWHSYFCLLTRQFMILSATEQEVPYISKGRHGPVSNE